MNTFVAQPNQYYHVGQPICRSKRECDVVTTFDFKCHYGNTEFTIEGGYLHPSVGYITTVTTRPMTWWERFKHEVFGRCRG